MAGYSKQDWDAFVQSHGGVVGTDPVKSDAVIHDSDPVLAKNSAYDHPNPYQAVKYTFKDGTYITVRPDPGTDENGTDAGYNVVNGGTAQKGSAASGPKTTAPGSATDQWLLQTDPKTGETTWVPNKNYVAPAGKDTVPGTGTAATPGTLDQNGDPIGGTSGTPDLPVDVYTAQKNAENAAAGTKISQQNANTAAANAAETARQNQITNDRADAKNALDQKNTEITQGLQAGTLSLNQAIEAYKEAHDQVSDWLTQRGQDIQARGQDLTYLGNQSYVTKGQYESLQGAEGQLAQTGGVAFTPSPTPPGLGYDPAQLAASLAQQALGQTQQVQQPFSLGQAPAAPAGPGFVAPSFEQGGIQTNNPGTPPLAVAARR